jgi:hypothetical protein
LGDVEFGRYCLTAPNVYISSGRHYFNHSPNFFIKDQDEMVRSSEHLSKQHSKKVTIEDDVWIGTNAVIMSGITIGRGSIIGSNSVVTQHVLPFSIMGGTPAKLLKKRLDFVPKQILNFNNDDDLPNFYMGFFVDVKNLTEDRKQGGVSASANFRTYMTNHGSRIQISIKTVGAVTQTLVYNNQYLLI